MTHPFFAEIFIPCYFNVQVEVQIRIVFKLQMLFWSLQNSLAEHTESYGAVVQSQCCAVS